MNHPRKDLFESGEGYFGLLPPWMPTKDDEKLKSLRHDDFLFDFGPRDRSQPSILGICADLTISDERWFERETGF